MKAIALITPLIFVNSFLFAQDGILGDIYRKDNSEQKPVPYSSLREGDVMFSKRIWRIMDLSEKINLPYKYPLSESSTDRKSLMDVFMDGIKSGKLTAYGFEDDEFTMPITLEQIMKRGGAGVDTIEMASSIPPYPLIDTPIVKTFSPDKVIAYCIKEEWFFDKQRSVMDVRIIGIAPLMYALDEAGNIREGNYKIPLFWIYYPEARERLANSEVFLRFNNSQRPTFDDLFQQRFFGSYIIKESNVYDRRIDEYKQGITALLEAEKIKNEIIEFEHDMWEF